MIYRKPKKKLDHSEKAKILDSSQRQVVYASVLLMTWCLVSLFSQLSIQSLDLREEKNRLSHRHFEVELFDIQSRITAAKERNKFLLAEIIAASANVFSRKTHLEVISKPNRYFSFRDTRGKFAREAHKITDELHSIFSRKDSNVADHRTGSKDYSKQVYEKLVQSPLYANANREALSGVAEEMVRLMSRNSSRDFDSWIVGGKLDIGRALFPFYRSFKAEIIGEGPLQGTLRKVPAQGAPDEYKSPAQLQYESIMSQKLRLFAALSLRPTVPSKDSPLDALLDQFRSEILTAGYTSISLDRFSQIKQEALSLVRSEKNELSQVSFEVIKINSNLLAHFASLVALALYLHFTLLWKEHVKLKPRLVTFPNYGIWEEPQRTSESSFGISVMRNLLWLCFLSLPMIVGLTTLLLQPDFVTPKVNLHIYWDTYPSISDILPSVIVSTQEPTFAGVISIWTVVDLFVLCALVGCFLAVYVDKATPGSSWKRVVGNSVLSVFAAVPLIVFLIVLADKRAWLTLAIPLLFCLLLVFLTVFATLKRKLACAIVIACMSWFVFSELTIDLELNSALCICD